MFRHLTMAIFRLYIKYLVNSYMGLIMGCTVPLYTAHNKPHITAYKVFHVQPEDDHCQVPKHVVVPYVVNTIYTSSIK